MGLKLHANIAFAQKLAARWEAVPGAREEILDDLGKLPHSEQLWRHCMVLSMITMTGNKMEFLKALERRVHSLPPCPSLVDFQAKLIARKEDYEKNLSKHDGKDFANMAFYFGRLIQVNHILSELHDYMRSS